MMRSYETQDRRACRDPRFVWRCHVCGRLVAKIERLDGSLEVRHKCGALTRLAAVLPPVDETDDSA